MLQGPGAIKTSCSSRIEVSLRFWCRAIDSVFAVRVPIHAEVLADDVEHRSYRFATNEEVDKARHGVNVDTGLEQDFGPTVLIPAEKPKTRQGQSS